MNLAVWVSCIWAIMQFVHHFVRVAPFAQNPNHWNDPTSVDAHHNSGMGKIPLLKVDNDISSDNVCPINLRVSVVDKN